MTPGLLSKSIDAITWDSMCCVNESILTTYEHVTLDSITSAEKFIQALLWCHNNLHNNYKLAHGELLFSNIEDSVAFKLMWL